MDQQFQEYLENVIELEKNADIQRRTIERLDAKIRSLGRPRNITQSYATDNSGGFEANIIIVLGSFIGAVFCGVINGLVNLRHFKFFAGLIKGALWGAIGGLALGVVIALLCRVIDKSKWKKKQRELNADYEKRVTADNSRLAKESAQKTRFIMLRNELRAQHQKTLETRARFYDVNVIYPKYRNIMAICSFYDYFMSGRCTELTGHEGAYNLYESELQLKIISDKLDEIKDKLDEIKAYQHQAYLVLSDNNRKIARLVAESEKQTQLANFAAEQSAIVAYNTGEMRAELNQLTWLKTYEMLTS
ncbi:MAG: hypothetical protein IJG45_07240 [Oscillospiraceae bacterium]|nr:hypothetical protein [Oscillospiraceae bacterium]